MDTGSGRGSSESEVAAAAAAAAAAGAALDLEGGAGAKAKKTCFPIPMLNKEDLLEFLPSFALAILLGVTAINVLTSNQSLLGDTTKNKVLREFLLAMPYTLFLFSLVCIAAAAAVKRNHRLLGCATGILLAQLLCLVLMGGAVTLVRGEVKPTIVWPVACGIIIMVLVVWSLLCAYPKWLRCLLSCGYCGRPKEQAAYPKWLRCLLCCGYCGQPKEQADGHKRNSE